MSIKEKLLKYLYWIANMVIMGIIVMIGFCLAGTDSVLVATGFLTEYRYVNMEQFLTVNLLTIVIFSAYWTVNVRHRMIEILDMGIISKIISILIFIVFELAFIVCALLGMSYARVGLLAELVNVPDWIEWLLLLCLAIYPFTELVVYIIFLKKKENKTEADNIENRALAEE